MKLHSCFRSVTIMCCLAALALAKSSPAETPDGSAAVLRWNAGVDPSHVDVYDSDGNSLGQRDLHTVAISGKHARISGLGLIQVSPQLWIMSANIELEPCHSGSGHFGAAKGGDVAGMGGAFGSGNGC